MSGPNGPITEEQWAEARRASLLGLPQAHEDGRLPSLLLPYQARGIDILDDPRTRVLVVEKSRRIGYTWGLAAHAVLKASRAREARGMDVMYISYSQEMTREFVDAAAMWARAFALAAAAEEEFLFADADPDDPGETREIKAFRIRFASGFEIIALSSAPRSLRGKQGLVVIDEAAFVESLKELLKAALAFLMWGGQVVVVSTHNGDANPFNELVNEILSGRKPYKHLRIDFDQALKDGLYQRICLVTGDAWTPEKEAAWRAEIIAFYGEGADEELFCVPSKGSGAWLTGPLIEANMLPDIPVVRWRAPQNMVDWPEPMRVAEVNDFCERELKPLLARADPSRRSCFGQDFGRSGDGSVLNPIQIASDLKRISLFVLEMRDVPFEAQKQILFYVVTRLPRFWHGALDATGNGAFLAEVARSKFGPSVISEIKFSTEWYLLNMPKFKAALEDRAFLIPRDDDVLQDYRAVRMEKGIAKVPENARYKGRDGASRHGDTAIAGALAHYASNQAGGEVKVAPFGMERASVGMGAAFLDDTAGAVDIADFLRM